MRWCRCSSQPRAWHTVGAPCGGLGDRPSRARGPCCPRCTLFPEPHPSPSQLPPSPCGGSGSPGGLADRKTQARSSSGNPDQARGASLSQSSTQTGHLQIILPLPLPRGGLSALTFSASKWTFRLGSLGSLAPTPPSLTVISPLGWPSAGFRFRGARGSGSWQEAPSPYTGLNRNACPCAVTGTGSWERPTTRWPLPWAQQKGIRPRSLPASPRPDTAIEATRGLAL